MSFSGANYDDAATQPVSALQYRDIALSLPVEASDAGAQALSSPAGKRRNGVPASESELDVRILQERAEAVLRAEQQLRQEYEQKLNAAKAAISTALQEFQVQRADYFSRVEAEVVQLSLSIAAKILWREAQVDPMLVATLVRMTVEKMREGSSVTARVGIGCGEEWKRYLAGFPGLAAVTVMEDPKVTAHDCVLETDLGSAHFGIDAQLKEVERGFFDLLALRPGAR